MTAFEQAGGTQDLHHDDEYYEEEPETRGNLTFKPPVEVLPKTKRTELLQKRKIDELKRKKQAAEEARKRKETEMAMQRQQEQTKRREKERMQKQKEEQDRRKREEEEQRKKLEGGLDQILAALRNDTSPPHITVCGIDLNNVRLRLLTRFLADNKSCLSLDLSRKGLNDEDGELIGEMLEKNKYLQKLECEGNNLGVQTAKSIAEALKKNDTLRSLNLESNNLTASSNDQKGVIELANSLKHNKSLRVLMLSKNGVAHEAGEAFEKAIDANESLIMVDLMGNDPSLRISQLRKIDETVHRNRERQSEVRRAERRERFALYNEEFKCRQYCMQVEAMRLEIEAHEERRLNRMKARFEKWVQDVKEAQEAEAQKFEELMTEAQDRADANKGRKKKK